MVLLFIALWGVGVLIKILFKGMDLKEYEKAIKLKPELKAPYRDEGADDGGFLIGILERMFIIASIIFNMPLVIGFVLTTKSIARLKKFDNDRFVEMFIIGSMISFISAIVIGYFIKLLVAPSY